MKWIKFAHELMLYSFYMIVIWSYMFLFLEAIPRLVNEYGLSDTSISFALIVITYGFCDTSIKVIKWFNQKENKHE